MCDSQGNGEAAADAQNPSELSWIEAYVAATPEVERLTKAVEEVRKRPSVDRAPDQLGAELMHLRHQIDLLELEFAKVVEKFAASEEWMRYGSLGPVHWLRHECHMSWTAANAAVEVGQMSEELPKSVEALGDGLIGFGHLGLMAGTAQELALSSSSTGFDEGKLLKKALTHTVGRFRRDCAHARHAGDAEAFLAGEVQAVEGRSLEFNHCPGGVILNGFFDAAAAATIQTALEPLARCDGPDDDRNRDRRLADALLELIGHKQRAQLLVTTTMETLLGLKGAPAGELEFSPPIPAATVQRLACDAAISRVILGPDSAVIDVGRALRLPSAATRRALRTRDGGCAWPRCERSVSWTVPHHVVHWAHGGETNLDNLVLLCYRHHWMVHEGGWQIVRSDDGRLLSIPPDPGYLERAREPDHELAA
jgi:hypothetical protein